MISSYSTEKMSMLKQLLVNNAEAEKPSDYEIRVDDLKVVSRTSDPEHFDNYEEFVTPETRKVVVLIYDGTSRRNTRHTFLLKDEAKRKQEEKGLSGLDLDNAINQKLDEQKRQWKTEQLEKENKDLKKQVDDAEEFIDQLQQLIETLKSKRGVEEIQWGKMLGIAATEMLKNNPKLIAKVPLLAPLAGTFDKENDTNQSKEELNGAPKAEASFRRQEEEQQEPLSEEEQQLLPVLKVLSANFGGEELDSVQDLLNTIIDKPKALKPTLDFCLQWKEHRTNEKQPQVKTEQENSPPTISDAEKTGQQQNEEKKVPENM